MYVKSSSFDSFPFPDPTPDQRATIADLAEELDATREPRVRYDAGRIHGREVKECGCVGAVAEEVSCLQRTSDGLAGAIRRSALGG